MVRFARCESSGERFSLRCARRLTPGSTQVLCVTMGSFAYRRHAMDQAKVSKNHVASFRRLASPAYVPPSNLRTGCQHPSPRTAGYPTWRSLQVGSRPCRAATRCVPPKARAFGLRETQISPSSVFILGAPGLDDAVGDHGDEGHGEAGDAAHPHIAGIERDVDALTVAFVRPIEERRVASLPTELKLSSGCPSVPRAWWGSTKFH